MTPRVRTAAVLMLLDGKRISKYDLADSAHCDHRSAQRVLKELHTDGVVKIAKWVSIYQQKIPVYAKGIRRDAPKPAPVTSAERMRRVRRDPSVRMDELMRKRVKRARGTSRMRTSTFAIGV